MTYSHQAKAKAKFFAIVSFIFYSVLLSLPFSLCVNGPLHCLKVNDLVLWANSLAGSLLIL